MKQLIEKAIDERSPRLAGRVADVLRFKGSMNYDEVLACVRRFRPEVTPRIWEALMYEADEGGE